jgi:hypothetical protein
VLFAHCRITWRHLCLFCKYTHEGQYRSQADTIGMSLKGPLKSEAILRSLTKAHPQTNNSLQSEELLAFIWQMPSSNLDWGKDCSR